jgi:hypothetical protein
MRAASKFNQSHRVKIKVISKGNFFTNIFRFSTVCLNIAMSNSRNFSNLRFWAKRGVQHFCCLEECIFFVLRYKNGDPPYINIFSHIQKSTVSI